MWVYVRLFISPVMSWHFFKLMAQTALSELPFSVISKIVSGGVTSTVLQILLLMSENVKSSDYVLTGMWWLKKQLTNQCFTQVFYFFNTSSLDGKNKLNKVYFYFCCSEALRTKYTFCNLQLMIFNRRKKSYEMAYIHSHDNTCVQYGSLCTSPSGEILSEFCSL